MRLVTTRNQFFDGVEFFDLDKEFFSSRDGRFMGFLLGLSEIADPPESCPCSGPVWIAHAGRNGGGGLYAIEGKRARRVGEAWPSWETPPEGKQAKANRLHFEAERRGKEEAAAELESAEKAKRERILERLEGLTDQQIANLFQLVS